VEELLKNNRTKIDAVDEKGETALLKAASKGHTHTATVLVKAGANVNMVDTRVCHPIPSIRSSWPPSNRAFHRMV
jgi:ankyrin repeat protein